jgi:hypothetical protein
MGATAAVHPTDQILRAYAIGKLNNVSSQSVSKYLELCNSCQRRAAGLSSDSCLGRLRDVQGQPGSDGPVVSSLAGLSCWTVARVGRTSGLKDRPRARPGGIGTV